MVTGTCVPACTDAIKWPAEDGAADEGTELSVGSPRLEAKEPTEVQDSVAVTSSAISPQTEGVTIGQSTVAEQQSVQEQEVEQDVTEQAGEQGASEQAESTEEVLLDGGSIDAAEAEAAGISGESAGPNNEHDSGDALVSASDASIASDEIGTS